ncbi:MAG: Two-component system response regulator DccR [uncultured Sulfurovum sp.]|uniref:Two-component system response regulator DccR n=1 Tax=uncultured Sulfurovum sp. TaxID=269237 RepID=A0A6S6SME1_9BACT|nr:MAG: Two-component system response regulator DccR [uncultured Sulfurovum sp.]
MNILLLEDDPLLSKILTKHLSLDYEVTSVYDGDTALETVEEKKFDLLILDSNVPGITGLELIKELRSYSDTTPIIMITAYQDTIHLKKAFTHGCNDYIKKPFELDELDMRISNITRTFNIEQNQLIQVNNEVLFDALNNQLIKNNKIFSLAKKESELLNYLATNRTRTVSKEELTQNLWTYETMPSDATLRVYIRNLRALIGKESIETIRGMGYRLVP